MTRAKSFNTDAHWASINEGYHHKVLPIIVKIKEDADADNPLEPKVGEPACKVEYAHYMNAAYYSFDPLDCLKFSVPFATTVFNPATNRDEPLNDIRFWWVKWLQQRFEKAKYNKDWRWLDVFYRWHHDWTKDLTDSPFEHLEGYHRDYGKPAVWFPPHEVPIKYPLVFDWWMGGLLPNNTEESLWEWNSQASMAAYAGISLLGDQLREMMQPSLMFDLGGEDDETFLVRHMNQMCVSFTCKPLNKNNED